MTYLYKIELHPVEYKYIIRKYEIVRSTPKKFYIQPREIKNKQLEKLSVEIWKDSARRPLPTINDYFYSTSAAYSAFIARQENVIQSAKSSIKSAMEHIEKLKNDIPESSLQ